MPHIQTWPPTMRIDATLQEDGYGASASDDYHDSQSVISNSQTIEPIATDKTFEPPIDDSEPGPGQSHPTDGDEEEQTFSLSASNDYRDDTSFDGGATFEEPLADDKTFEPPVDDSEPGPLRPDPADDDGGAEAPIGGGGDFIVVDLVGAAAVDPTDAEGDELVFGLSASDDYADAFIFVSAPVDPTAEPASIELPDGELIEQTHGLETGADDRRLGIMQSVEPVVDASDTPLDEGVEIFSADDLMM